MVLPKIYSLCFLDFVSFALLITTFDQHVLSLGGSHFFTGLLGSLHALLQLLSNPVIGGLTDTKGRKPVLLKALLFCLLFNFLLCISNSFVVIFIARIIYGLANQTQIIVKVLISDHVPQDQQAAIFGKLGALAGLGFIVGPILAGHLSEATNGFLNVCLALTAITLINIGLTLLLPNTPPKISQKAEDSQPDSLLGNVTNELKKTASNLISIDWKIFWDLFSLRLFIELAFSMFYTSFAMVMLKIFMISQKTLGYSLALHSVFVIAANLVIGPIKSRFYLEDKAGVKRLMHASLLLLISVVGLAAAPNFWIYVFFLIPLAATRAFVESTWNEVLMYKSGGNASGVIIGAFESIMPLSGFITPLLSGLAIEYGGYNTPVVLSSIPALAGMLLARTLQKTKPKTM